VRYAQNKEQSAEILRLVLPLMARQEAAYHPLSYALWYEHVTGLNPELTSVLDERQSAKSPLTEHDVRHLYARHIAARDAEAFEHLQQQLHALLDDTSRTATDAGAEADKFAHALDEQRRQLSRPLDTEAVRRIVAELLVVTERMRTVTGELSETLAACTREIEVLSEHHERSTDRSTHRPQESTGIRALGRGVTRARNGSCRGDAAACGHRSF
jgi:diguanylate cyclase